MTPLELAQWLRERGLNKHSAQMTLHGHTLVVIMPDGGTDRLELNQQAATVAARGLAYVVS